MSTLTRLLATLLVALPTAVLAQGPGKVVTFGDVMKQLDTGATPADILSRCDTVFTLTEEEKKQLTEAKAPAALVDALQTKRMAIGDVTDFVVILDCSGSMKDDIGNRQTKMEAAKKVVGELFDAIPNGRNLSFIVYGHDASLRCDAVKVAHPLGKVDNQVRKKLRAEVNNLTPGGHTPIAKSLRVAGDVLEGCQGISQVVVITDGMETCHGDPAAEAEALTRKVKRLRAVEVIGVGLKNEEKEAVSNVARRGRGKYYDAESVDDLKTAVAQAVNVEPVEQPPAAESKPQPEPKPAENAPANEEKPGAAKQFATELVHSIKEHTNGVLAVAFSPDGSLFATASKDKTVRLWDTKTGERKQRLINQKEAYCVAFSPDGKRVAVGSRGGEINVFDVAKGVKIGKSLEKQDSVVRLKWSPDGRVLASVDYDSKVVQLQDVESGKVLFTLAGHTRAVNDLTFSPDGSSLATVSDDSTVRLWDTKTGKEKDNLTAHDGPVQGVAFSADGTTLVTAGKDNTVVRWDVKTGNVRKPVMERPQEKNGGFVAVVELPNGRIWAVTSGYGHAVFDPTTGKEVARKDGSEATIVYVGKVYPQNQWAVSPDRQYLGVATGNEVFIVDASKHFTEK